MDVNIRISCGLFRLGDATDRELGNRDLMKALLRRLETIVAANEVEFYLKFKSTEGHLRMQALMPA